MHKEVEFALMPPRVISFNLIDFALSLIHF